MAANIDTDEIVNSVLRTMQNNLGGDPNNQPMLDVGDDADTRHTRTMDYLQATRDIANDRKKHEDTQHQQTQDMMGIALNHDIREKEHELKRTKLNDDISARQHKHSSDILGVALNHDMREKEHELKRTKLHDDTTARQHKHTSDILGVSLNHDMREQELQLKRDKQKNDYELAMMEQQRRTRELNAKLNKDQAKEDDALTSVLEHTRIHTRMMHERAHPQCRKAGQLITKVGAFTTQGTEDLVNELLVERMKIASGDLGTMPQHWRDCVSEIITSHGEITVSDLRQRYVRLRSVKLDHFVLTDNDDVHTNFARAVAAHIRQTHVASGLMYKSKFAIEASQRSLSQAIRFFARVTWDGHQFNVQHRKPDMRLPERSAGLGFGAGAGANAYALPSFWHDRG